MYHSQFNCFILCDNCYWVLMKKYHNFNLVNFLEISKKRTFTSRLKCTVVHTVFDFLKWKKKIFTNEIYTYLLEELNASKSSYFKWYVISLVNYLLCTVWKFKDFSVIQILLEINFDDSRSSKSAFLTNLEALDFDYNEYLHFLKAEICQMNKIESLQNCKKWHFDKFHVPKNWFHGKSEQKNPEIFTLCIIYSVIRRKRLNPPKFWIFARFLKTPLRPACVLFWKQKNSSQKEKREFLAK